MPDDTKTVVKNYFESWKARDFPRLRSLLADDVDYVGPLGHVGNGDGFARSVEAMSKSMTEMVVHKMIVDGADALTWFDLHTKGASTTCVANWSHVENGKITRVRVTFDPRGLLAANQKGSRPHV
jgi:ketosteroid isomerase-like protein